MLNSLYERWDTIDWLQVDEYVLKLQKKIFNAAKDNDFRALRRLQKTAIRSYFFKLKAIRRVTQDNQGKATAGTDGVKNVHPSQRLKIAEEIKLPVIPKPLKRVWIDKPGSSEKRPLGIPTITDRISQAILKLAIEPEWESKFEKGSYGFRPGRRAHDAVIDIRNHILKKPKYILDADIKKCFDKINHEFLLNKLGYKGTIQSQIRMWLKSGILDKDSFYEAETGTPQGGIISPLLANVALHGLEGHLKEFAVNNLVMRFPSKRKYSNERLKDSVGIIRYADDFVVIHEDHDFILKVKEEVKKFLTPIGLEINEEKTSIRYTLDKTGTNPESDDLKAGFNFLGFTFIQKVSNHRSSKDVLGNKTGFKTLIYPSKKSRNAQLTKLHNFVFNKRSKDQALLIKTINPIISGWSRYFGISDANTMHLLTKMDYNLYLMLRKWAKNPRRSSKKAIKLWKTVGKDKWVFGDEKNTLINHRDYSSSLNNYIKIKGSESPYSGNNEYWDKRIIYDPYNNATTSSLLKRQSNICTICKANFTLDDITEIDHIIPRSRGGSEALSNKQLIHRHCHHNKTRNDNAEY